ncbi:transglycosylase domain-containing protein [Thioclava atlantica]|uniref:peptidoglycan glycosyltransferase n=1 Tax=Thioclava atlantica TaxID=1317124 RepID=A0A085TVX1_9RHOB|nr:transglycosylase domain-containing protein [Thioclava atlantica]KFE34868.1 1A family penicillin-binding protein [Thioclava atlantica]
MTQKGGRRGPLRADKRYSSSKQTAGKSKSQTPPKTRNRRPQRPPRRHGPVVGTILGLFRLIWRVVWGIGWRFSLVVALVVGAATLYFYSTLPDYTKLLDGRTRGSVTMLDDHGKVFAWRGETFGGQIDAKNVSPWLRDAVIATEDRRFYHHFGISPRGIASAMAINLRAGRGPFDGNGGSTITQQTAKLLCLGVTYDPKTWKNESAYEADCRSGGLRRKIKEVPYAFALELKYTKDEILSIYFNRAYLGAGARGFEAASERYFGIPASNLDPQQAAMLAGLLKAPSYYAPTNSITRSQERAQTVLTLMHDQGYLNDRQYIDARDNPATLSQTAQKQAGGYFADWLMDTLPSYLTRDTTEDVVIHTTLDQRIQSAAEEAMQNVFDDKVSKDSEAQSAIVVMSKDGAVRGMVGGRQTKVTGAFNHATMAQRQTGSTFKPFVYATALDLGYTPGSMVDDAPLTVKMPGSPDWSPRNYERNYMGPISLTTALEHSVNVATVRVSEAVGRENVIKVAEDFGFAQDLPNLPSVALGVGESDLLDMTGAYAGILNGGSSVQPYGLTSLTLKGDDQPLFGKPGGIGERVISQKAAQELVYMMRQVVLHGTGRRANLDNYEVAGKTGTTQSSRDAWFIGFTSDYVVGVWMGNDDNTPLKGVTGGGLPAEIFHETMKRVMDGQPAQPLPMADPSGWQTQDSYQGQSQQSQSAGQQPARQRRDPSASILKELLGIFGAR